jgi:hypothetical protein
MTASGFSRIASKSYLRGVPSQSAPMDAVFSQL